jgi:hypothetical protein
MVRQIARLAFRLGAVAALVVASGGLVLAQTAATDPALQGRLLRRSDGTVYVFKDGLRYRVVPAELSDSQIDAIPEAGLLVERLGDLFTLVGSADGSSAAPGSAPPPLAGSPPPAPAPGVAGAVAGLVGQSLRVCDFLHNPLDVAVERAEQISGIDDRAHVLLLVNVNNVGTRGAQAHPPVQLRDDQGRAFDQSSLGLSQDLVALGRQYGIPGPAPEELPAGVSRRALWAFQVAPDVKTLALTANPMTTCASATETPG